MGDEADIDGDVGAGGGVTTAIRSTAGAVTIGAAAAACFGAI